MAETELRTLTPRLLTREQAAEYCGISVETFDDWRTKGWMPPPLSGRHRWDIRVIDRMLDVQSGLAEAHSDFSARRTAARKRQQG